MEEYTNSISFKEYLSDICRLTSSQRLVDEIRKRSKEYVLAGVIEKDIYSIHSSVEYHKVLNAIKSSQNYIEYKAERKRVSPYSGLLLDHALNKYLDFLRYKEGKTENETVTDIQKYNINLGIGRVQNITANNVFLRNKSLYEFVASARGKKYSHMPEYCDSYFNKKNGRKYFGQIITPMNLLGLIQTDEDENIIGNALLDKVWKSNNPKLARDYINYFLCMWQYPIPSTKPAYGREMKVFKPYCLLLKMLLELHKVNIEEAYLTTYDFAYLFLEPEGNMPDINTIDQKYANWVIQTRAERKKQGIFNENGSLTYIINTLAESDLLTIMPFYYLGADDFYVGLANKTKNHELEEFIIRAYSGIFFPFDSSKPAGTRDVMSDYGKYINNMQRFEQWRTCCVNISRISEFKTYCKDKGFFYSDDLIRRFVLSLEAKPFLLLTGISGSGKTKIAELWIMFLKEKGKADGLQIAVGSNWTDNKKLLGFKNVLLEEKEAYQSTDLVELIRIANRTENAPKEYIVILDEMNLSRVEMYFADFLSALESISHEIILPNGERLVWTPNLKIIGTVNVDESTYMFSPKVLDRANVIEMNGRSPKEYINSVLENDEKIYASIKDCLWFPDYVALLEKIHESLNGEFAYRVIDEISRYLAINTKLYGDDEALLMKFIDEQISQKILPKLHGSKAQLKPKLDRLQELFENTNCSLTKDKLIKMQEDIKKGYASFIGD